MEMDPQVSWDLIIQTVILLLAIVGTFMRIRERIVALEIRVDHYEKIADRLIAKVDGLSRVVAENGQR